MSMTPTEQHLVSQIAEIKAEMRDLEREVADLRRFQAWVTGIAVGAGAIFGIIVGTIKSRLGLS